MNYMSAPRRRHTPDPHTPPAGAEPIAKELGSQEAGTLRRHARDLTALLALPAMWHGREPAYIIGSLLDVLLRLLRLDCVYVGFDDPEGGPVTEDWRPRSPTPPEEIAHALAAPKWGERAMSVAVSTPIGNETIRVARLSPGFMHERGMVLAGSRRTDFPTELEQVRLQVAVDQATISIHDAHLLARERAARAAAEAAHRQLAFLAEASTRLAASLDFERTLQTVANLAVPLLADACIVNISLAEESLDRIAVAHSDPATSTLLHQMWRRYPAQAYESHPIARAMCTGHAELVPEILDALLVHIAGDDSRHLQLLRSLGVLSLISVPLVARRRTLGAMTCLQMESGRRYGPADLSLAEELARRAAVAVDNTRLYREAQEGLIREQALRTAAEKLAAEQEAILRQITDGVVIADGAGRITFVNEAARSHFGFETLGVTIEDYASIHPPLQRDGRLWSPRELPLARASRGETVIATDMRVRRLDGQEIAALVSATPLVAEDGTQFGAVMTIYDVSSQRALERQKDEFFANVSHDLRTPLAAIVASIGVVLANEPPEMPAPLHRMLENSEQAAERMTGLVDNLLELTRVQAGRIQLLRAPHDLRELAQQMADAISPLAQARGQRVELDLPAEPTLALVDTQRLEQVLLNLLSNAHMHGREGGIIRLSLARHAGEVVLAVTDDGPGIAAADQERIFERYYRSETEATRHKHGSGLGLPIARALVDLHGGRLWLESTPGAGATFWISLPADKRSANVQT
ncbi:MAG: Two-component hybrid sensor and regulator [Chloroflexi bacterium]|nr:Two-component hybrid sensor and regulator [Chloroflexota bacterium]